jgi:hypothetical protein
MAVWYSLWSFGIFFPFWYVWTYKNLATLVFNSIYLTNSFSNSKQFRLLLCNDNCKILFIILPEPILRLQRQRG